MPEQARETLGECTACKFLHNQQGHWPTSLVLFLEHPAKDKIKITI